MKLLAGCILEFESKCPVPTVLMLRPRSGVGQFVLGEKYLFEPNIPAIEYTDSHGNLCQRVTLPEGRLRVRFEVTVETAEEIDVDFTAEYIAPELLPDGILRFLLPSRYCQSDLTGDFAQKTVEGVEPGYPQVEAIRAWIHNNIRYEYGTSDSSTTALDILNNRVGVCRDFAHLGISLCRSLNIPARIVVGYLYNLKPMDLHAWFEAYVGNRWYTFDATQTEPMGNRIAVAYGFDAADVALSTHFGFSDLQSMEVWVNKGGE